MPRIPRRPRRFLATGLLLALAIPNVAFAAVRPTESADRPAPSADEAATDLRITLSRLLGEHAFLLLETVRAITLGDGTSTALRAALDDNSSQLRDAIGGVYGDAAATRFASIWDTHVDLLSEYADARKRGDAAAAEAAADGLDEFSADLSELLASANPALDPQDEAAALRLHVEQITQFTNADYAGAYAAQRRAFTQMFELGDHLALGMARQFPDRFEGGAVAFSPRSDLRLTLDRLFAEHLVLAAEAMRAGVAGAPDFEAGADALGANTADLTSAIADVYGGEAGDAFRKVWEEHIDAYLAFVGALGSNDAAARESSLADLRAYHDHISEFLAGANPHLNKEAVAALIRRHVQALISQAEATEAGDEARAIATTREAYAGTFDVGAALAAAIVQQFPDRFRDLAELPPTDTPGQPARPGLAGAVLALLLAAAAAVVATGTPVRRPR